MSESNKNNIIFEFKVIELIIVIIVIMIGVIAMISMHDNQEEQTYVEDTTMIEGECCTYLDEFKRIHWPTLFCTGPKVGQMVESLSTPTCSLRIQQITHCEELSSIAGIANRPYLKIELR